MKTISFIPPDGIFELMSYRLTNVNVDPLIWCEMKVEESSATRIEYVIKITQSIQGEKHTANNIVIKIPVRSDVISPEIKCEAGSITYSPELESMIWIIKSSWRKSGVCKNKVKFSFNSGREKDIHFSILGVNFEIPYFTD